MSLTTEQKEQIHLLLDHRDQIIDHLAQIEKIIKHYFPEEFSIAYQHWIPQIVTALYEDKKWLPRGQCTMEQTIIRLMDKLKEDSGQGVKKYI